MAVSEPKPCGHVSQKHGHYLLFQKRPVHFSPVKASQGQSRSVKVSQGQSRSVKASQGQSRSVKVGPAFALLRRGRLNAEMGAGPTRVAPSQTIQTTFYWFDRAKPVRGQSNPVKAGQGCIANLAGLAGNDSSFGLLIRRI